MKERRKVFKKGYYWIGTHCGQPQLTHTKTLWGVCGMPLRMTCPRTAWRNPDHWLPSSTVTHQCTGEPPTGMAFCSSSRGEALEHREEEPGGWHAVKVRHHQCEMSLSLHKMFTVGAAGNPGEAKNLSDCVHKSCLTQLLESKNSSDYFAHFGVYSYGLNKIKISLFLNLSNLYTTHTSSSKLLLFSVIVLVSL